MNEKAYPCSGLIEKTPKGAISRDLSSVAVSPQTEYRRGGDPLLASLCKCKLILRFFSNWNNEELNC